MSNRLQQLTQWLQSQVSLPDIELTPASSDASFRRYFRFETAAGTRIVMDAPPDKEDCRPFVAIAKLMQDVGLHVPEVLASDLQQGFLLLSDLGARQYLDVLTEDNADALYGAAMTALQRLHGARDERISSLPAYTDELLHTEMALFRDWLLLQHLQLELSAAEEAMLAESVEYLAASALAQPRVCVHRDYHSRNLMLSEPPPGILDFQDAVFGPVTYDLASLLKDCYIAWPRPQVEAWVEGFYHQSREEGRLEEVDAATFLRWFDLMGAQRHLKAAGIFARLYHRDGKSGYLKDIPRTLNYIVEIADLYPPLAPMGAFLRQRVLPGLAAAEGVA